MLALTSKSKNLGFGLVEVMIVVALIGILAGLAIPSYKIWIQNTRIRTTTESIQNGLQKAKSEALKHNAQVRFTLNADSSWSVGCVTPVADLNLDGMADCPAQIDAATATEATIDIDVGTDNGYMAVTFNNLGIKEASLAASEFNRVSIDMDASAMNPADSRDLDIIISAGGGIKMCDSNLDGTADLRRCV